MGKRLIQQRRGKGSGLFRSHTFRAPGKTRMDDRVSSAVVTDIIPSRMHSAPLLKVTYDNDRAGLMIAPEGVQVGDEISIGGDSVERGNILSLKDVPLGTTVCNIEGKPGDGGKFVRGSGGAAKVVAHQGGKVVLLLPSKKRKAFNPDCRAMVGNVAGGGRKEKPLVKAGTKFHVMKGKNKYWPKVSGTAMNAVAHPFGGKRSGRKGRPTIAPRNAPPGRKVGMLRPRKTGRARGTRTRKS